MHKFLAHLAKVQSRQHLVPLPALVVSQARPVALEEPPLPVPVPPQLVEVAEDERPAPRHAGDVSPEVVDVPRRGGRGQRPLPVRQDGRDGRTAPGTRGRRPEAVPRPRALALRQLVGPAGPGDGGERRVLRRVDRRRGVLGLGAEGVVEGPRPEAAQALSNIFFRRARRRDGFGASVD